MDKPARLLTSAPVAYPEAARATGIEADVPVHIVIDERGYVVDSRLAAHAGYGLDEAALAAVKRLRFAPAERAGRPVRVGMRWPVAFRLR